jgi:hypothetical protein
MARPPLDDDLSACVADDPRYDAQRSTVVSEYRPLLDVELEKGARQGTASGNERPATDATDLLAPERDDRPGAHTLHGLDRGDDAERSVETPTARDGVEMRPDPHRTCPGV